VTSRALTAIVLLLVGLATGASAQDLDAARQSALAGDQAYEAGDFDLAVEQYEEAVEAGLDSADLHYNLANAHYKQGELGRAIAGYTRALRRDPRHAAARENLSQAQTQQRDEALEPLTLPVFLKPFGWIYSRVGVDEWAFLSLAIAFALGLILIARQWGLISGFVRGRAVGLLIPCLLVALTLTGVRYQRDFQRERAVVVAEEVGVRSGPGTEYNLSFKVHEGLLLYVSERRGGWMQIHLGGELVGWVPAEQLEVI